MIDAQKPESSSFKSGAWSSQEKAWEMVSDLWQSPLYIREQGEKYLEKFKKEQVAKYEERKNRSVPRNKFRESIETMAGMVFKRDPAPKEAPTALQDLFTDIDACGNDLHSFCLTSFERYLRDGGGAIWVDATPLNATARKKTESGEALTAADRKEDRPFWVYVEARQIINHRYEKVGGVDTLIQATIEVSETEAEGEFGEVSVKRHYILRPGSIEVRKYDAKSKTWSIEPDKGGPTGLTEIPLVPLAPFGTPPPLLDLAMLTVQFYNKESDFDNWCHYACVPRQIIKLDDEATANAYKKVNNNNPDTGLLIFGQSADAKYLEVTGKGLDIVKQRLEQIDARMAAIGVGMLAPTEVAPRSATEVLDTAGQRQSKLARYAREFENAVEKAFYFTAKYLRIIRGQAAIDLNETDNTELKLVMDFERLTFDRDKLTFFKDLLMSGDLSHETFYEMLPNVLDMPKDWTPELEKRRLAEDEPVINAGRMPGPPNEEINPEGEAFAQAAAGNAGVSNGQGRAGGVGVGSQSQPPTR